VILYVYVVLIDMFYEPHRHKEHIGNKFSFEKIITDLQFEFIKSK